MSWFDLKSVGNWFTRHRIAVLAWVIIVGVYTAFAIGHHRIQRDARKGVDQVFLAFTTPELNAPSGVISADQMAILAKSRGVLRSFRTMFGRYTPIVRWGRVHEFPDSRGGTLYTTPDYQYESNSLVARPNYPRLQLLMLVASIVLVGLGAGGLAFVRPSFATAFACCVLLRLASLFWTFSSFGLYTTHVGDETRYLEVAQKIVNWNAEHDVLLMTTLGNSLFYVAYLLFVDQAVELELTGACSVVYFFIFGMGVIACIMGFLLMTTGSLKVAIGGGCLWVVYPWFMRIFHYMEEVYFSYLGPMLQTPSDLSIIDYYYYADFVGFNALSDTPALVFGLAAILTCFQSLHYKNRFFLAGFLFGFSCLFRITNVFYSIPLAYLFLNYHNRWQWRQIVRMALGFTVIFMFQLIWNAAIFGDPLTFGYKFVPRAYRGFELSYFPEGVAVAGSVFQQLMGFSALALWRGYRTDRVACVLLSLMILPLLVFYSGFLGVSHNPLRYFLLPLVSMAAACPLIGLTMTSDRKRRVLVIVAIIVAACFIPVRSYMAFFTIMKPPAWLLPLICGIMALVAFLWAKDWSFMVYFLVAAVRVPQATFGFLVAVCVSIIIAGLKDPVLELVEHVRAGRQAKLV